MYDYFILFLIPSLDILSMAAILALSLPLVHQHKLKALPLSTPARLLTSTISTSFNSGTFLSSVSASVTLSPQHHAHISVHHLFLDRYWKFYSLPRRLQSIASSPLTLSLASISRNWFKLAIWKSLKSIEPQSLIHLVFSSRNFTSTSQTSVYRDWVWGVCYPWARFPFLFSHFDIYI